MGEYGLIQRNGAAPRLFSSFRGPEQGRQRSADPFQPLEILLVEDNPADVRFFREALHLAGIRHQLSVVTNGEEALMFLRQGEHHRYAPRPGVILLDLKLPRVGGHTVLGAIRLDPELRSILIVVLTSSHELSDRERGHDLDAAHYVTKPIGLDVLAGELKLVEALARRRRS